MGKLALAREDETRDDESPDELHGDAQVWEAQRNAFGCRAGWLSGERR